MPLRATASLLIFALLLLPAATLGSERDLVSLDLAEADMLDVLRYFAEISELNLIVDPAVKGSVTVRLIDVPWDQALTVILRAHGFWYELDGNVMYIAPLALLAQRAEDEATLEERRQLAAPLSTIVVRLSYANPDDIARIIEDTALSPRGSVTVDHRSNRLIITDVESRLPRARRTVRRLDR